MSGPWTAQPGTIRWRLQRWLHANPGSTADEIARAVGVTLLQARSALQDATRCGVVTRAIGIPVRYTCAAPQHIEVQTVSSRILDLAAAPDGVTVRQCVANTEASESRVRQVLASLRKAGQLVVQRTGKSCRYFASTQDATAWRLRVQPHAKSAPVVCAPRRMRGPTLLHHELRVITCPSVRHDPRYQCAPGHQPDGAGFARAGIGRDIETGRPWA